MSQEGKTWTWRRRQKYGFRDFHKFYRNTIEKGSIYDIDYKLYSKIMQEGNKLYLEALFRGKVIKPLPGLGEFQVYKYNVDPGKKVVDWGSWYRNGIYKYIDNDHSGGKRFFVKWIKCRTTKHMSGYRFTMIKYARGKLYEAIVNGLDAPIHNQKHKTRRRMIDEFCKYKRSLRQSQE